MAVKVVKSDERYTEAAADEIKLLEKVCSTTNGSLFLSV